MSKGRIQTYTSNTKAAIAVAQEPRPVIASRLDDEKCATCRHWVRFTIAGKRGECRCHAPYAEQMGGMDMLTRPEAREAQWPLTYEAAGCGEWEGR